MRHVITIAAFVALSGCATAPTAEQICTADWIEPRVDRAVGRIETRLDKALGALLDAGESWVDGRSPGPLTMFRLSNSAKALEKELKDGRGVRDLRLVASTCDNPDLIRTEILSMLERRGVSASLTGFLEATGLLDEIIRTAEGPTRQADRSG
ncbi:hypothetical protein [uncultured Algimonas sp.]|uniref:hypothetical protein n=1 Tax=uncultured Algimonas sp. TaxID=1547920 RepID=UPI00260F1D65|nr:hypothetical protein [uncultured Algimonas sp.]